MLERGFVSKKGRAWQPVYALVALFGGLVFGAAALGAQETPVPDERANARLTPKPAMARNEHRFWDKENGLLFAGVGAMRTMDYFSTLNMRRRGRQEIFLTNDAVDNHAGFAFIEAGATSLSIGASYLFHRYGHHKLERWTSIVHIGLAGTGAARNYSLKTAHFQAAPSPAGPVI
jgi:hypothetical protein